MKIEKLGRSKTIDVQSLVSLGNSLLSKGAFRMLKNHTAVIPATL